VKAPVKAPEKAPEPPPRQGAEAVRRLVLQAHEGLAVRDHFEVLGVSPEASPVELRSAYARLARTLHPDACQDPALADLAVQRETVFRRVCQAYETLRDPDSRARYESDLRRRKPWLPPPGPTVVPMPPVPPRAEAPRPPPAPTVPSFPSPPATPEQSPEERLEQAVAVGEEMLRDGHYFEAIRQIEPTLQQARGGLRVRARLALARACLRNPKWAKRAEAHLLDALQEDPARVEAHLLLGDIYGQGGLRSRALSAYRRALELQPHNRQAQRELARLESTEPTGAGTLLGFLKKR